MDTKLTQTSTNNNYNTYSITWMEYPHGTGNYIKKRGQVWNFIHQQQCLPFRYSGCNTFHTLPNPHNTEEVFGSKNNNNNKNNSIYSHKFA
jgi:hypothetical protein